MTTAIQNTKPIEKGTTEYTPLGAADKIKLSVGMVKSLLAVKTKSGATCSDEDALKFIAMCIAKRMNPFEGDAYLIGYDTKDGAKFSLIAAHQTYLKRAEVHPEFDGMTSGLILIHKENGEQIDSEGDFYRKDIHEVVGGWATVFFKQRKVPTKRRVRLDRFQKGFGVWVDDPAGMICKCAEADALRSSFPTMLGGLYTREEMGQSIDVGSGPVVARLIESRPVQEVIADAEQTVPVKQRTLIQEIEAVLEGPGYDFNAFQKWCINSNQATYMDSCSEFSELKEADAKRIVRMLPKMLSEIAAVKGGTP